MTILVYPHSFHFSSMDTMEIPSEVVITPTQDDVLCGHQYNSPRFRTNYEGMRGQQLYDQLIIEHGSLYQASTTKRGQMSITRKICDAITASGGRFLSVRKINGEVVYKLLERKALTDKISKALKRHKGGKSSTTAAFKTKPSTQQSTSGNRRLDSQRAVSPSFDSLDWDNLDLDHLSSNFDLPNNQANKFESHARISSSGSQINDETHPLGFNGENEGSCDGELHNPERFFVGSSGINSHGIDLLKIDLDAQDEAIMNDFMGILVGNNGDLPESPLTFD